MSDSTNAVHVAALMYLSIWSFSALFFFVLASSGLSWTLYEILLTVIPLALGDLVMWWVTVRLLPKFDSSTTRALLSLIASIFRLQKTFFHDQLGDMKKTVETSSQKSDELFAAAQSDRDRKHKDLLEQERSHSRKIQKALEETEKILQRSKKYRRQETLRADRAETERDHLSDRVNKAEAKVESVKSEKKSVEGQLHRIERQLDSSERNFRLTEVIAKGFRLEGEERVRKAEESSDTWREKAHQGQIEVAVLTTKLEGAQDLNKRHDNEIDQARQTHHYQAKLLASLLEKLALGCCSSCACRCQQQPPASAKGPQTIDEQDKNPQAVTGAATAAEVEAEEQRKKAESERDALTEEVAVLKSTVTTQQKTIEEQDENLQAMAGARTAAEDKAEEQRKKAESVGSEGDALVEEVTVLESKVTTQQKTIEGEAKEVEDCEKMADAFDDAQYEAQEQQKKEKDYKAEVDQVSEELSAAQQGQTDADAAFSASQEALRQVTGERDSLLTANSEQATRIETVEQQARDQKAEVDQKLEDEKNQSQSLKEKFDKQSEDSKSLERQLSELKTSAGNLKTQLASRNKDVELLEKKGKEDRKAHLKQLGNVRKDNSALKDKLTAKEKDASQLAAKVEALEDELRQLKEAKPKTSPIPTSRPCPERCAHCGIHQCNTGEEGSATEEAVEQESETAPAPASEDKSAPETPAPEESEQSDSPANASSQHGSSVVNEDTTNGADQSSLIPTSPLDQSSPVDANEASSPNEPSDQQPSSRSSPQPRPNAPEFTEEPSEPPSSPWIPPLAHSAGLPAQLDEAAPEHQEGSQVSTSSSQGDIEEPKTEPQDKPDSPQVELEDTPAPPPSVEASGETPLTAPDAATEIEPRTDEPLPLPTTSPSPDDSASDPAPTSNADDDGLDYLFEDDGTSPIDSEAEEPAETSETIAPPPTEEKQEQEYGPDKSPSAEASEQTDPAEPSAPQAATETELRTNEPLRLPTPSPSPEDPASDPAPADPSDDGLDYLFEEGDSDADEATEVPPQPTAESPLSPPQVSVEPAPEISETEEPPVAQSLSSKLSETGSEEGQDEGLGSESQDQKRGPVDSPSGNVEQAPDQEAEAPEPTKGPEQPSTPPMPEEDVEADGSSPATAPAQSGDRMVDQHVEGTETTNAPDQQEAAKDYQDPVEEANDMEPATEESVQAPTPSDQPVEGKPAETSEEQPSSIPPFQPTPTAPHSPDRGTGSVIHGSSSQPKDNGSPDKETVSDATAKAAMIKPGKLKLKALPSLQPSASPSSKPSAKPVKPAEASHPVEMEGVEQDSPRQQSTPEADDPMEGLDDSSHAERQEPMESASDPHGSEMEGVEHIPSISEDHMDTALDHAQHEGRRQPQQSGPLDYFPQPAGNGNVQRLLPGLGSTSQQLLTRTTTPPEQIMCDATTPQAGPGRQERPAEDNGTTDSDVEMENADFYGPSTNQSSDPFTGTNHQQSNPHSQQPSARNLQPNSAPASQPSRSQMASAPTVSAPGRQPYSGRQQVQHGTRISAAKPPAPSQVTSSRKRQVSEGEKPIYDRVAKRVETEETRRDQSSLGDAAASFQVPQGPSPPSTPVPARPPVSMRPSRYRVVPFAPAQSEDQQRLNAGFAASTPNVEGSSSPAPSQRPAFDDLQEGEPDRAEQPSKRLNNQDIEFQASSGDGTQQMQWDSRALLPGLDARRVWDGTDAQRLPEELQQRPADGPAFDDLSLYDTDGAAQGTRDAAKAIVGRIAARKARDEAARLAAEEDWDADRLSREVDEENQYIYAPYDDDIHAPYGDAFNRGSASPPFPPPQVAQPTPESRGNKRDIDGRVIPNPSTPYSTTTLQQRAMRPQTPISPDSLPEDWPSSSSPEAPVPRRPTRRPNWLRRFSYDEAAPAADDGAVDFTDGEEPFALTGDPEVDAHRREMMEHDLACHAMMVAADGGECKRVNCPWCPGADGDGG
ncbi:MAG: hypothetical protein L6R37_003861 [Teloschistes peruensis]|nr:MAG: hypothetical protein L6R37_003861 [Teloschistes peruensis]